jgi:N-acetylmuramoyl-L-alanine amidase
VIDKIIVHCSASPQGRGDDAATIHRWHLERGWSGIGYHEVITEDGTLQNGRPWYWQGAHCQGHNKGSIGICLFGEGGDATASQLTTLKARVAYWVREYPEVDIVGHSDLDDKKPDCPGFDVKSWWADEEL